MASNGHSNGSKATTTLPLLINGKEVTTETTFPINSPSTGETLWHCSSASVTDALNAVSAASSAFPSWSKTKPQARRQIFLRAADILESRAEEAGKYMEEETGALGNFAAGFNVPTTVEMLRDIAGRISGIMGFVPTPAEEGTGALILKEPFGVVLGIAPWNAPYILGTRSVAFALATGNTCILKGSELSPRCFLTIAQVFAEAGLPAGCLNVIFHRPQDAAEITTKLIEHPKVKKINFTGSTAVGSIIASTAGKNLKPVLMELGGKASAIVLDDADIDNAAMQCALGAFLHSGQICMASERIVIHKSVMEPFTNALKSAVAKVYPEDKPAPVLVASATVDKNRKLVGDAVKAGAKVVYGNLETDSKDDSKFRMRPVIVKDVSKEMDLYYTESFGPSVSLIAVDSEEEAVKVANDTEYGLSGAVFTKDLGRGLRIAKQIQAGAVHINAMTVHDESVLPHGGYKKSGFGRFNSNWGLEEFLQIKTITFKE